MSSNSHYWSQKEERAMTAEKHHRAMEEKYGAEITRSCKLSAIYSPDHVFIGNYPTGKPYIEVINSDTVSAALDKASGRTAILNFASYKDPGGMFLQGSRAQEECLCHESTLFETLIKFCDYYNWNKSNLNRGLYLNRAIASPDVIFERPGKTAAFDVITCAAPNASVYLKYNPGKEDEVKKALDSRVAFIKDIVEKGAKGRIETLILGAYGCGVFGLDPTMVAKTFKRYFETSTVKNIYFAIIEGGNSNNFEAFKKVFS